MGRCSASPEDLDTPGAHQQTKEMTDWLISSWDPVVLWTDFGVCADIVVSIFTMCCFVYAQNSHI
jgi:hypothetical protein